jgi:hypothetical protein
LDDTGLPLHVPAGHYYSPIPGSSEIRRAQPVAGAGPREIPGVDLDDAGQWALVRELLPLYEETAAWLLTGPPRFSLDNTWFSGSDALFLALMLRHLRPANVLEIGSGYSSALVLDADSEWLGRRTRMTFVDPNPDRLRAFLGTGDAEVEVLPSPVQDVPPERFARLGAGDMLLVDSSHVLKAGSDVHLLLLDLFPRLAPGVYIHLHDIFHPFEYPAEWLAQGVAFNEAYALRALLQGNGRLRIVLWNHYLERFNREWFAVNMPLALSAPFQTGGIWLRVEAP